MPIQKTSFLPFFSATLSIRKSRQRFWVLLPALAVLQVAATNAQACIDGFETQSSSAMVVAPVSYVSPDGALRVSLNPNETAVIGSGSSIVSASVGNYDSQIRGPESWLAIRFSLDVPTLVRGPLTEAQINSLATDERITRYIAEVLMKGLEQPVPGGGIDNVLYNHRFSRHFAEIAASTDLKLRVLKHLNLAPNSSAVKNSVRDFSFRPSASHRFLQFQSSGQSSGGLTLQIGRVLDFSVHAENGILAVLVETLNPSLTSLSSGRKPVLKSEIRWLTTQELVSAKAIQPKTVDEYRAVNMFNNVLGQVDRAEIIAKAKAILAARIQ